MFVIYAGDRNIRLEAETIAQIMGRGKSKITLNGRTKTYDTKKPRELYIAVGCHPEKLANTFEEEYSDHSGWVNGIIKKSKCLKHETYDELPNKILIEGSNYVEDDIYHSILRTSDLKNNVVPSFQQNDEVIDHMKKDVPFSLIKLDIPEGKTAFRFHFFTDNFPRFKDSTRYSFYDVPEALGKIRDELKMLESSIDENKQTGLKEIYKILKENFGKLRVDYLTHVNHDLIVAPSPRYNIRMIGRADRLNKVFLADHIPERVSFDYVFHYPTFISYYRNGPSREGVHFQEETKYWDLVSIGLDIKPREKVSLGVAKERINEFIEKNNVEIENGEELDIVDLHEDTNIDISILLDGMNALGLGEGL